MNKTGVLGEMQAVKYLRKKKYKIIDTNYRTRFGEIDIICEYENFIVFAEVKTRSENSIAQPMEFVDGKKQKNIINIYILLRKLPKIIKICFILRFQVKMCRIIIVQNYIKQLFLS